MIPIDDYDYELPPELIAQHPLPNRVDSRLLVVDRRLGTLTHAHIRDLPAFLRAGDCLVLNDSRVVPARLVGRRERTGAKWTGLFLSAEEHGAWKLLGKTRGRLEPGESVLLDAPGRGDVLRLRMLVKLGDGVWAARPESETPVWDLLDRFGRVPLPPYIRQGEMNEEDSNRYQTVYAAQPGSVAAPTAGLHFTPELLAQLGKNGVKQARVTLHVGIGTFRPVAVKNLEEHAMHSETCEVSEATCAAIAETRAAGGRIVAVGTTSMRTLESASLSGKLERFSGETNLFIRPGFVFHTVDALLTNFHLPKSTLLVLVRTFGGDELLKRAYAEAIAEQYRFFSYGDAMLIL